MKKILLSTLGLIVLTSTVTVQAMQQPKMGPDFTRVKSATTLNGALRYYFEQDPKFEYGEKHPARVKELFKKYTDKELSEALFNFTVEQIHLGNQPSLSYLPYIKALLSLGADPNYLLEASPSGLGLLKNYPEGQRFKQLESIGIKDIMGDITPLGIALFAANPTLVEMFLAKGGSVSAAYVPTYVSFGASMECPTWPDKRLAALYTSPQTQDTKKIVAMLSERKTVYFDSYLELFGACIARVATKLAQPETMPDQYQVIGSIQELVNKAEGKTVAKPQPMTKVAASPLMKPIIIKRRTVSQPEAPVRIKIVESFITDIKRSKKAQPFYESLIKAKQLNQNELDQLLWHAAALNNMPAAQALVTAGANPGFRSANNTTALDKAKQNHIMYDFLKEVYEKERFDILPESE